MSEKKEMTIGGISFGITSGIITTLGLIVGLNTATNSKLAIIAGILTIAIADSCSDALGMHLSEESRKDEDQKPIWLISFFVFLGKMLFSLIFIIPFLLFSNLQFAVMLSVLLGLLATVTLSMFIAQHKGENPTKIILEHSLLTIVVIILSYWVGEFVGGWIA